ncbi:amyloid beta precursor protein binding family B member 2-like isoform X3 [Hetaerina americana]|uniref:amyloid beta precursor protein binding family B member 2-like isoform X3 n=1 Tax=Hetaerina americana TaxID=62018 RepID=UPI003A7F2935
MEKRKHCHYSRIPEFEADNCNSDKDHFEESECSQLSKNGLLSYENPNYHLDPARLDDALNSNTDTAERLYEELCHELDAVCLAGGGGGGGGGGGKGCRGGRVSKGPEDGGAIGRRGYAALDIGSMGVDVTSGPVTGPTKRKQLPKQEVAVREVLMDQAEDGDEDGERAEDEEHGDGVADGEDDTNENNRGSVSQCQHRKQLHMSCPQTLAYDTSSTTLSSTSPSATSCLPSAPPLDNSPLGCITSDNGNKGNCVGKEKTTTTEANMGRRTVDAFTQGGNMTQQMREDQKQHHRRQHKNGSQKTCTSSIQQPDLIQHAVESQHQKTQLISSQMCNTKTEEMMDVNSPDTADNGIQVLRNQHRTVDHMVGLDSGGVPHIQGHLNNDLYAVPVKRPVDLGCREVSKDQVERSSSEDKEEVEDEEEEGDDSEEEEDDDSEEEEDEEGQGQELRANLRRDMLPPGWERHEDGDGPYYWHIKSGTIQREPPTLPTNGKSEQRPRSLAKEAESALNSFPAPMFNTVTRSSTSSALEDLDGKKREERREEMAFKRRSFPARSEPEPVCIGGSSSSNSIASRERPIRFAVRSLGWVEIAEEDLTPERSSKAVNKCIVDLSLGRNDLLDVVGRWGDGKDLFMDLDEGALKLIDPENLTVLNTQPIHTIRVWGVGRDNGRDFAYVARDRTTRKHMCHVFRCDIPARTIANTLRDICKKIMIERSLQQSLAKPIDIGGAGVGGRSGLATRPTNLPTEHRRFHHRNGQTLVTAQSFPTPMEEPKKVLRAQYLGQTQVSSATGMDVLNDAIDLMKETLPSPDLWRHVNVAVAPSMISILDPSDDNKLIAECRVRYLSFLGIGRNVKQCGFIMHTAQDLFIAHIFHCEPSSGALCKTVEAACKLRYQKCLDAHPQNGLSGWNGGAHGNSAVGGVMSNGGGTANGGAGGPNGGVGGSSGTKGITATLKLLVGSLTGGRRGGNGSNNRGGNRNSGGRCVSAVGIGTSHNMDS